MLKKCCFLPLTRFFWLPRPWHGLNFVEKAIFYRTARFSTGLGTKKYNVLLRSMRISQKLDFFLFFLRLPVRNFFLLPFSHPFSRPFYSRYLLRFIFFLAALKHWAKLQNTGPLLIIHQTSRLVWLVCCVVIHCWTKLATKYNAYTDYSSFIYPLSSQQWAKRVTKIYRSRT